MKRLIILFLGFVLLTISSLIYAANLMDVYRQALISDPVFQQARAEYLAATEAYPQARALLLPNVQLTGSYTRNFVNIKRFFIRTPGFANSAKGYFNNTTYTLQITQPIFDFAAWSQVYVAKADVRAAAAQYAAAAQDLMLRVAEAYFGVLRAQDDLRFTKAEKRATARQLDQAIQRFKVGLDAITSVYDARAEYDAIVAQEIAAKNSVINNKEQLRELTGRYYNHLAPLKGPFPLLTPDPADVEKWVDAAGKQNLAVIAARESVYAAKENIKVNFAGHLPVVDAVGQYTRTKPNRVQIFTGSDQENASIGLELTFPIYQGGLVNSQTRQAEYEYQQAVATFEDTYRQTVVSTRQTYNNIIDGISKIKADRQAIISRAASVRSTEAALNVGTRTIVDLLQAQRELYGSERIQAADQYDYLLNTLRIKQLAGTLNATDLAKINKYLSDAPLYRKDQGVVDDDTVHYSKHELIHPPVEHPKKMQTKTKTQTTTKAKQENVRPRRTSQANRVITKEFYSIQLLAAHDKKTLLNYIRRHNLKKDYVAYIYRKKDGKDWYELLYGYYANFEQARKALSGLPKDIQRTHPWIRPIRTNRVNRI